MNLFHRPTEHTATRRHRPRGVALMLVMVAIIVSGTVAYSYLGSQSTSAGIARNIRASEKARYVAESGMEVALAAITKNSSWRTQRPNGTWITNQSLAGGTFTIVGQDGSDTNGDGVVDGDGSLSDDGSDLVTLTVTGKADGAAHVIRAVVAPQISKYGYTSALPSSAQNVNDKQVATLITIDSDQTITSISLYGNGPPPKKYRLAIYSSSGGEPATLLAQTSVAAITSSGASWYTLTLSSALSVQAGSYWLAFSYEHQNENYYYSATGGQSRFKNNNAITNGFTSTWGASSTSNTYQISIYVTVSANANVTDWVN